MIIPPPIRDLPRYTSWSFPAYRYVPKFFPHPFRSEMGHQHRNNMEQILRSTSQLETSKLLWQHGCDLFAFRYYWEAHEFWEEVWKEAICPLKKKEVQAAIKMAASILKRHMNHIDASQKLWNQSFQIIQKSKDPFLLFWQRKAQKFHVEGNWEELEIFDIEEYTAIINETKM